MKKIILLITIFCSLFLCSCTKEYDVEKHELRYVFCDISSKTIYMYDITMNTDVSIKYSYELFGVEFIKVCQIKGTPLFTFLYSNGTYYRL